MIAQTAKTSAPPLPPGAPPPMPGFYPAGRPIGLARSNKQREIMSWEALARRVGLGIGPTPARWSTYPGDELTPEKIVKYRKEAHSGYPWRWADLCEQQIENNSHIRSLMHFRRAWAMSDVITWRIDAAKEFENDEAAQFVAAWQSAVLNQPGLRVIWADRIYQLLSASAYGYAAVELFWDWRTIEFSHKGKSYAVRSYVPVHMEFIHQKSFRFDLDTDEPGLYTADSSILKWPFGKILFHRCLGDGITDDLSVLITGSILAQSQGSGTGSYGASAEHAITAHIYRVPDGTKLAADISGGMLDPMLHYNVEPLAEAFGVDIDVIRKRSGVFGWKANGPAPTVSDIIAQAKDLDGMGFPISQRELSQRSGWSIGESDDRLPGKAIKVGAGDTVIGQSLAGDGYTAPETQTEAQP